MNKSQIIISIGVGICITFAIGIDLLIFGTLLGLLFVILGFIGLCVIFCLEYQECDRDHHQEPTTPFTLSTWIPGREFYDQLEVEK